MSYETLLDTVHRNKWEETRSYEKPRSETDCRSQYSREYARLIHSPSFRRLQGKTQVLGLGESDFYRTRLTHSLEVMQIGRGIVDTLRFKLKNGSSHQEALQYLPDDKLIETICLAHDLGHPPFGHGGEIALNYCMLDHGGFEGNGQTLRILSKLEKYRKDGDVHYGINPSRRLLLGILKYPAPYSKAVNESIYPPVEERDLSLFRNLKSKSLKPPKCYLDDDKDIFDWIFCKLPKKERALFSEVEKIDGEHSKTKHKSLDTSIMNVADDIAYGVHDLEDGIVLELISENDWNKIKNEVSCYSQELGKKHDILGKGLFSGDPFNRKRAIGELVNLFIGAIEIDGKVNFSEPLLKYNAVLQKPYEKYLKEYLMEISREKLIKNKNVKLLELKGRNIIVDLFNVFLSDPDEFLLHGEIEKYRKANSESEKRRVICDYIAGMTDDYAAKMHNKVFLPGHGSIFDKI